ncbi:MAG TPA: S1 RNA-binding domain-containing protein [Phototrophicaceae bacterium]|jgi:ribosomal protein S1|nr:S1 RNA-binding domain-containing protein [Phototrophicaceae bacterium]
MSAPITLEALQPGVELKGTVKRIELYGAFVDIGVGTDALLHISQLGKSNVRNVEDVVKVGEETTVYVLKVDKDTKRIALSLVKPPAINWDTLKEGDILEGEVERIENFGAFINIGAERPGMVHVSEMAEGFVKSPSDVVKVGEKVQVRVLKINRKKRQIDLSMKQPEEKIEVPQDEEDDDLPTAMALALRKAMSRDEDDEEEVETFVAPRSNRRRGR